MDCGCPGKDLIRSTCNHIAYSSGPLESVYLLVSQVIPDDVAMKHGRPKVHPDGSLEFPDTPPELSGYELQDGRLLPVWPPCVARMLRVEVIDGILKLTGVCSCIESNHLALDVTTDDCEKCAHRKRHQKPDAFRATDDPCEDDGSLSSSSPN